MEFCSSISPKISIRIITYLPLKAYTYMRVNTTHKPLPPETAEVSGGQIILRLPLPIYLVAGLPWEPRQRSLTMVEPTIGSPTAPDFAVTGFTIAKARLLEATMR